MIIRIAIVFLFLATQGFSQKIPLTDKEANLTNSNDQKYGHWTERYDRGKKKTEGYYHVDTLGFDSVAVVDPETMDEVMEIYLDTRTYKHGPWLYWDTMGKLVAEEWYIKGAKTTKEEFEKHQAKGSE